MIHPTETHPQLSEYVLGLLPWEERRRVEQHAADCPACQARLAQEQRLVQQVKTTVQTAGHVTNGRLQQLMPPVPTPATSRRYGGTWQRQLASVCVLMLMLLSSFGLFQFTGQTNPAGVSVTQLAITATATSEPTETAVATEAAQIGPQTVVMSRQTAVEPVQVRLAIQPPAPTPLAALPPAGNH